MSTPTRLRVELPAHEAEVLHAVRQSGDLNALRQRVYALRQAKWPLRAIGQPLDDTARSTVRMWELAANPNAPVPNVPQCPRGDSVAGERIVRLRFDVPVAERERLKRLAESARSVRGWTKKDARSRRDADELDALLVKYTARGVPVKRLATHMGVTYRAVAARLERRTFKQLPVEEQRRLSAELKQKTAASTAA